MLYGRSPHQRCEEMSEDRFRLPSSSSFTTVRIWSLVTTMTPIRFLLLHHSLAPLLPWSGDGSTGPGEMGETAWEEMGVVAWGERGCNSSPPVLLFLTTGALVLAAADRVAPDASLLSPRVDMTSVTCVGRGERIRIFMDRGGRVRTMHMCIRHLLKAATVILRCDFSHRGHDTGQLEIV
jgi:hypothetical protein